MGKTMVCRSFFHIFSQQDHFHWMIRFDSSICLFGVRNSIASGTCWTRTSAKESMLPGTRSSLGNIGHWSKRTTFHSRMNVVKQWKTNSNLQFRDAFHNLFLIFSGQIGGLFIAGLYIYTVYWKIYPYGVGLRPKFHWGFICFGFSLGSLGSSHIDLRLFDGLLGSKSDFGTVLGKRKIQWDEGSTKIMYAHSLGKARAQVDFGQTPAA